MNPVGSVIIGLIAGVLVCLSVEFVDRVLKVDDPVGAISVHGANGLWGVIAVGLFADGKSNYGGSWNGVTGSVTGLFYGDASQLVAQLIGVATLIGLRLPAVSFVVNFAIDAVVGQRVGAKAELEGLDLPEMGALGYPEFELKAHAVGSTSNACELQLDCNRPRCGCRRFPGETLTRSRRPTWPATSSSWKRPANSIRAPRTCAPASAWRTP